MLEARFPLRLVQFGIRELEVLRPLDVSILSERRVRPPFGLHWDAPGATGRNLHASREVPGKTHFRAEADDRIRIETPGGGRWDDTGP